MADCSLDEYISKKGIGTFNKKRIGKKLSTNPGNKPKIGFQGGNVANQGVASFNVAGIQTGAVQNFQNGGNASNGANALPTGQVTGNAFDARSRLTAKVQPAGGVKDARQKLNQKAPVADARQKIQQKKMNQPILNIQNQQLAFSQFYNAQQQQAMKKPFQMQPIVFNSDELAQQNIVPPLIQPPILQQPSGNRPNMIGQNPTLQRTFTNQNQMLQRTVANQNPVLQRTVANQNQVNIQRTIPNQLIEFNQQPGIQRVGGISSRLQGRLGVASKMVNNQSPPGQLVPGVGQQTQLFSQQMQQRQIQQPQLQQQQQFNVQPQYGIPQQGFVQTRTFQNAPMQSPLGQINLQQPRQLQQQRVAVQQQQLQQQQQQQQQQQLIQQQQRVQMQNIMAPQINEEEWYDDYNEDDDAYDEGIGQPLFSTELRGGGLKNLNVTQQQHTNTFNIRQQPGRQAVKRTSYDLDQQQLTQQWQQQQQPLQTGRPAVKVARRDPPQPLQAQGQQQQTEVFTSPLMGVRVTISNLPPSVTLDDISELFGDVGALKRVRLMRGGQAEVVYVDVESAVRAVKRYNSRELDGQPMLVTIQNKIPQSLKKSVPGMPLPSSSSSSDVRPMDIDPTILHRALFKTSADPVNRSNRPVNFTVHM